MFEAYKNKKILLTGHTGFKGAWMTMILKAAGAKIMGYSLDSPNIPSLFELSNASDGILSIQGDVRDFDKLYKAVSEFAPEYIIHFAAQPIVREGYANPLLTYETNVMGTVNLLESIRRCGKPVSFLNVTTDKVYENKEWQWGYRENENLMGRDPYSNSKSCSELVTYSYIQSFFEDTDIRVSTARAGNVIGGGDFAKDRIIPDCVRAALANEEIMIRNPNAIRPFQHVLEPLAAYLMILQAQKEDDTKQGCYNVGPKDEDCVNVGRIVEVFCNKWGDRQGFKIVDANGPHEAGFLKLDCSKIQSEIGWKPKWSVEQAVEKVVEWTKIYVNGGNVQECMKEQISSYFEMN